MALPFATPALLRGVSSSSPALRFIGSPAFLDACSNLVTELCGLLRPGAFPQGGGQQALGMSTCRDSLHTPVLTFRLFFYGFCSLQRKQILFLITLREQSSSPHRSSIPLQSECGQELGLVMQQAGGRVRWGQPCAAPL